MKCITAHKNRCAAHLSHICAFRRASYTHEMNDDEIKDRQLNALVGGAVRGLVESGAEDEAIGAFAASYRQKAAKILGHPQEATSPPDLTAVIKEAVTQALAASGQVTPKTSRRQNEHFTVLIGGQKTSVTIHKEVIARLSEAKGSKSEVSRFVREVAKDVPETVANKSEWIEERIGAVLRFEAEAAGNSTSARH